MTLLALVQKQGNKCYYCNCEMTRDKKSPQHATLEHLLDKWASPRNRKIEAPSNLVAACFHCNNSRGAVRNRIARDYYKSQAAKKQMKLVVASTPSKILYSLFGSVPQQLFNV
jgi:hypothetical protein